MVSIFFRVEIEAAAGQGVNTGGVGVLSGSVTTHVPRDLTGLMLGEYRVGALLGVGGMGAVYEGLHPLIAKRVAVKVLLPAFSADQKLIERFVAEARSVNEIRHRNIVDIFSFGQLPDGSHYFLMEYLEGEAFDQIIKAHAPLPVHEALYWCEEVLEALGAAHDFGIIHRDVKPSNVFMVQPRAGRRYVKLLDFGIAKLTAGGAASQTQASVVVGTPFYMSPEQARGRTIGPTTDLYALGCMLFEMVTGRVVFPAENHNQVMFMHAEDAPPMARSLNPLVPEALDQLLQQLLKKNPAERPQTAEGVRMMCEVVRRQVNRDTSFTQVPNRPITGERPRASTLPPVPIPLQNRATPSMIASTGPDEHSFSPTVRSGSLPAAARPSPEPVSAPTQPSAAPGPAQPSVVLEAPPRSSLPWVLLALSLVALAIVMVKLVSSLPPPGPVAVAPVVPVAPPPVVPVPLPLPPVPVAVVAPLQPVPVPVPVAPPEPPRDKQLTAKTIEKRLEHVQRQLAKKEAETGDVDGVLRQFLAQLQTEAKVADTDAKRRAVMRKLDEFKSQLDGR